MGTTPWRRSLGIVGVGLWSLAGAVAHAQAPELVITRSFVRAKGTPVTATDTFTVCDATGQFTLAVDNGPGGEAKVSTGTIRVNGVEVIQQADFNQQADRIERALGSLSPTNTLEVQLGSQPGGTILISVLGVQSCGVRITSPAAGSVLTEPAVLVRGSVPASFGADIGVTVNGEPALFGSGKFAAPLWLDAPVTSLTVRVTSASGADLGTSSIPVTVQLQAPEPIVRLHASPTTGLAPLTVELSLTSLTGVRSVTLDQDGNGTADFQGATLDGQPFTYAQPGLYVPTASVTDGQGVVRTTTAAVQVYALATLESLLQAKWQGLKDALRRGDIAAASQFIVSDARARYEAAFTTLAPDLAAIDTILGGLTLVRVRDQEAIFELLRTDAGVQKSFEVRFAVDDDGIWRLRSF